MVLHLSPFPNGCVAGLHAVGWALILPCFWFLDRLIAVCKSTTLERVQRQERECYLHPLQVFFGSIIFFILFLVTSPVALLGFLLWAPLQAYRRPFSYHIETQIPLEQEARHIFEEGKATFGFATANLCLLPDSLARFNNLGHTQRRATTIGRCVAQGVSRPHIRIFIDSPSSCGNLSASSSLFHTSNSPSYGAIDKQSKPAVEGEVPQANPNSRLVHIPCDDTEKQDTETAPPTATTINTNQNSNQQGEAGERSAPRVLRSEDPGERDGVPLEVSSLFPANVDILCLEEVFDKRAARKLKDALGPVLGHILYDVGVYAWQTPCCSSFKFFNSGLFLASRFPVLEAQYYCFPNSRGEDALAAKGLLCAKVLIGQNHKQEKVVGYFNCTHLHAPEGEGEIRCEQLTMVTVWINEFQTSHRRPDEVVVFDVLCGDFNFDNCSPDDLREQNHNIFEEYIDPCRAGPGKEKPWVIGTLMEQPTMYEEDVITPDNLQRTLETEELRRQYISPPVPVVGVPLVYPLPDEPWVGRRIDYILYRQNSLPKHYKTEIEEFTYITQLAGLTDHIPVGLRLRVSDWSAED
ncbi:sphingomyelin phosphodiesterase 5 isoform X1 [Gadus macrocephalus]|uniref:sphingomyelin phosphodiesterase 5 isoform X1 n=1 Tax=Gadus macrocephalus TaxID=80720 RepID=UPI0028CB1FB1|nr:sphingomyelin phosphodiesterase 5 isoform X1 [Gadus macrocephalus]